MGGIIAQILAMYNSEIINAFVAISAGININTIQPSKMAKLC